MMRPLFVAALLAFSTAVGARAIDSSMPHDDMLLPVFSFLPGGQVAVMCCCPPEWLRRIDDALYCSVPWHVAREWAAEKGTGR